MDSSTARSPRPRGRTPRAERDPDQSRLELLDAAEVVFARRGFAGATVGEIVRSSGLSKGTFYWHYASKEALFLDLVDDRIDAPVRAAIDTLRSDDEHPSDV